MLSEFDAPKLHGALLLPARHQGVYARLRRAMEKVGMRGPLRELRLAERPPHPPRFARRPLPARGERWGKPRRLALHTLGHDTGTAAGLL
jgi:hypothetical protein